MGILDTHYVDEYDLWAEGNDIFENPEALLNSLTMLVKLDQWTDDTEENLELPDLCNEMQRNDVQGNEPLSEAELSFLRAITGG